MDRRMSVLYAIAVIAALYLGRHVLVPVALAILLTFVVVPLVTSIERRVRRRSLAVLLATLLVTGIVGCAVLLAGQQVVALADQLPEYRNTIVHKIRSLEAGPGGSLHRFFSTLKGIGEEIVQSPATPSVAVDPRVPASPLPPTVVTSPAPAPQSLLDWSILRSLIDPLASAAIVLVLMVMMLMYRENIRDRIIRLAGLHQIGFTTQTLEETGARIGRYLRAQLVVNAIFALAVGSGLLVLNIPNALLCGLVAGILRFIPVIGPWLGAAVPAVLALAVFDGWFHLVMVIALFAALDLFNVLVLEPWLFGTSTGLSSFGVILAIIFWTWVWGPIGLILAVPMTVCLVVFTRHISHFSSLSILLGDEPVLSESTRYYQRLLCRDEEEAASILAATPADAKATQVLQDIVIASLSATRADLRRELITADQAQWIAASARDIALEWLSDRPATPNPNSTPNSTPANSAAPVLCLPAHDALDDAAAAVLTEALRSEGVHAALIPGTLLVSERIAMAHSAGARLVIVTSVGRPGELPTRRICKALQQRAPDLRIVAFAGSAPGEGDASTTDRPSDVSPAKEIEQASTCEQVVSKAQTVLAAPRPDELVPPDKGAGPQ